MVNEPSVFEPLEVCCIWVAFWIFSSGFYFCSSTLKEPEIKTVEFADSVAPDEAAHNALQCLVGCIVV